MRVGADDRIDGEGSIIIIIIMIYIFVREWVGRDRGRMEGFLVVSGGGCAYTNTNCAPFLHMGHECPSCCPVNSRRTHLPWQWGADSTVHLVARSIVPWPGQRKPSDWRIACVSQRTHTRSPAWRKKMKKKSHVINSFNNMLC